MKSNRVIAGLIFLAFVGAAIAGTKRGETVIVGNPDDAVFGNVIVYDAGTDIDSAINTLRSGDADFVRFQLPVNGLKSACDDAVDCAQTIKDTCALIDPSGSTSAIIVTYNGSAGSCDGTCADGQSVTVVCAHR